MDSKYPVRRERHTGRPFRTITYEDKETGGNYYVSYLSDVVIVHTTGYNRLYHPSDGYDGAGFEKWTDEEIEKRTESIMERYRNEHRRGDDARSSL